MEQLTTEMIMVMAMICVAIFLFIVEWIRVDVVAILMMVSLPLLHLVTPKEAFVGFSSNAVISIIAVIIIGAGLDKTGIINRVVTPVLKIAGNSTSRIVIAISITVAGISSFMQNIGAAALFLPAIQRVSKRLKIPISQILMPVGFCAILGGTMTLVGSSPLILLNDLLVPFNLTPFGLFDVTPMGAALVASGIAYFVLFGRFILPKPKTEEEASEDAPSDHPAEPYDGMGEPRELCTPEDFTHYREPLTIGELRKRYPVFSVAIPSGIRPASRKIVRQSTDSYASSIVRTRVMIIPRAPVIRQTESWILKTMTMVRATASQPAANNAFSGFISSTSIGVVKIRSFSSWRSCSRFQVPWKRIASPTPSVTSEMSVTMARPWR